MNTDRPTLNFTKFETLTRIKPMQESLESGATFKAETYEIPGCEQIVNVYSIEVPRDSSTKFGMQFSKDGEYCMAIAHQISQMGHRVLAAMNCNFGFVTTFPSPAPLDLSFNLKIQNGTVFQLPVADKTACIIRGDKKPFLRFLKARGVFLHAGRHFTWRGSLTKSHDSSSDVVLYNSFNSKILQLPDPVTGTVKVVDDESRWVQARADRVLVTVTCENGLKVKSVGATRACVLTNHLVIEVARDLAAQFISREQITVTDIDGVRAETIRDACSIGAILTQDPIETEQNILASTIIQTRTQRGERVYTTAVRHARACIVESPTHHALFLADARSAVRGQEGLTIPELQRALQHFYPSYTKAANVDGGNAAKLVTRAGDDFRAHGNLHYKIWPKPGNETFRWDGIRGRRIPGVIYIY